MRNWILTIRRNRRRRAFTLAETVVALGVFTLVMTGVSTLYYLSAVTIKELYGPTRARSARMAALNQIRFRLCDARIDSCVFFENENYQRIQYKDPGVASGGLSEFLFNPDNETLTYDSDISDGNDGRIVAKGPIDITFKPGGSSGQGVDALVLVYVATAEELAYANVDERDGETVIYLRNPPE
ncbi:MAG: prepilin-type N-terminal cleavage/methylation domain-containing protein [Candidatus Sumerlaeia bacterium]